MPAPDRLRDLLDLVVGSLDEPAADGRALAARAHFSRDHLDRLLSGATGESPVALRRRLLLERAAWELRARGATPTAAARRAGYGSLAAFSRAFLKAYGVSPSAFAEAEDVAIARPAPNGVRFHPPAGVAFDRRRPGGGAPSSDGLAERLVGHHLAARASCWSARRRCRRRSWRARCARASSPIRWRARRPAPR